MARMGLSTWVPSTLSPTCAVEHAAVRSIRCPWMVWNQGFANSLRTITKSQSARWGSLGICLHPYTLVEKLQRAEDSV